MNNQEKNTYVRNQILRALLNMMQEQPFADISISALVSTAQSFFLPQFYGQGRCAAAGE